MFLLRRWPIVTLWRRPGMVRVGIVPVWRGRIGATVETTFRCRAVRGGFRLEFRGTTAVFPFFFYLDLFPGRYWGYHQKQEEGDRYHLQGYRLHFIPFFLHNRCRS